MQTSAKGVAFLERHEGVVLRAYRCPAGIWTIGAGLTAASGVVKPKAGMVITRAEATRLVKLALERKYEPAVLVAMPGARLHEFDGGVSFHWNTGAIGRATWVKRWRVRDWPGVAAGLKLWTKGGGKVLPGLVRRREDELRLIRDGDYGVAALVRPPAPPANDRARVAAPITAGELPAIRAALSGLGYAVGLDAGSIDSGAIRHFQRDHGLTADGIIGRATASALQRVLDARTKAKPAAGAVAVGGAGTASDGIDVLTGVPGLDLIVLGAAAVWALWLAWQYRDAVAPAIEHRLPRLAAFFRRY